MKENICLFKFLLFYVYVPIYLFFWRGEGAREVKKGRITILTKNNNFGNYLWLRWCIQFLAVAAHNRAPFLKF